MARRLFDSVIDILSGWFGIEDLPDSPKRPSAWTRTTTVALDSASFQARLLPDVASLRSAINLANRVDRIIVTQSFLSDQGEQSYAIAPFVKWATAGKACKFKSEREEKQILGELLEVFTRGGFFDDLSRVDSAVAVVSHRGSTTQLKMLIDLMDRRRLTLSTVSTTEPMYWMGLIHAIQYSPNDEDMMICELIKRSSDEYLNRVFVARNGDSKYISALNMAVVYGRVRAVRTLIERFPGVDVDVRHPTNPYIEQKLVACIPHAERNSAKSVEIRALLTAGDRVATAYHLCVSKRISAALLYTLPPELIGIIDSYAARAPLASVGGF